MPIPASILGAIPWALLIEKAPLLWEGSQKLRSAMRSPERNDLLGKADDVINSAPSSSVETNAAAIRAIEEAVEVLDRDLKSAVAIISDMTEANAGLVRQVGLMKIWLLCTAALAVVSLTAWVIVMVAG